MSKRLERFGYSDIAHGRRDLQFALPRDRDDNLKQFVAFDISSKVVKY